MKENNSTLELTVAKIEDFDEILAINKKYVAATNQLS